MAIIHNSSRGILRIMTKHRLVHLRQRRENKRRLLPLGELHGLIKGSLPRQHEDGNINSQTKSD